MRKGSRERKKEDVITHLQKSKTNHKTNRPQPLKHPRKHPKEQRRHQKALRLNPLPTQLLHCEDCSVVSWYESEDGDDDVPDGDFEEAVPGCAGGPVEADLLEDDVLVEVDAVEAEVGGEKVSKNSMEGVR